MTNLSNFHEDLVHHVHEVCGCIGQLERNNHELILAISGDKGCLHNIFRPNLHLMVARSQVNLGEVLCLLQLIKQVIYARQ